MKILMKQVLLSFLATISICSDNFAMNNNNNNNISQHRDHQSQSILLNQAVKLHKQVGDMAYGDIKVKVTLQSLINEVHKLQEFNANLTHQNAALNQGITQCKSQLSNLAHQVATLQVIAQERDDLKTKQKSILDILSNEQPQNLSPLSHNLNLNKTVSSSSDISGDEDQDATSSTSSSDYESSSSESDDSDENTLIGEKEWKDFRIKLAKKLKNKRPNLTPLKQTCNKILSRARKNNQANYIFLATHQLGRIYLEEKKYAEAKECFDHSLKATGSKLSSIKSPAVKYLKTINSIMNTQQRLINNNNAQSSSSSSNRQSNSARRSIKRRRNNNNNDNNQNAARKRHKNRTAPSDTPLYKKHDETIKRLNSNVDKLEAARNAMKSLLEQNEFSLAERFRYKIAEFHKLMGYYNRCSKVLTTILESDYAEEDTKRSCKRMQCEVTELKKQLQQQRTTTAIRQNYANNNNNSHNEIDATSLLLINLSKSN